MKEKEPKIKKSHFKFKTAIAAVMALTLSVSTAFGVACKKENNEPPVIDNEETYKPVENDKPAQGLNSQGKPAVLPAEKVESETYENEFATTTAVGFSGKIKGTVDRVKPVAEVKDYGLATGYPKFGYSLNAVLGDSNASKRDALIAESSYLTATGTSNAGGGGYTWMDKDGYLYKGTTAAPEPAYEKDSTQQRQLFEHTAAAGLYFGDVADDEPGIVKEVNIRPRGYSSYSVTGVYAPAGEVIKIEISEEDMNATGGLVIHIGQALYNGQANNIWTAKNQMQRIPHLLNTMVVNKNTSTLKDGVYTAYVGSFIGGPLYIRNTNAAFTATISGGVKYSHFILGYTTKEEFEEDRKSSAPYFDLEVWHYGVLHSGPKNQSTRFTYEDLYKAAILWEKVSSVTTTGSNQGIVFLYEPFVAAGAAVAFPGRSSVNCPTGWMAGSLNYNGIVNSGSWGNFHEYHHNFQGYGVGNGGEVTNNGLNLVSYALFTRISANRGISNYGAESLGGWNSYTSAPWALNEVLKIAKPDQSPSNGNQGLALYATLLHNFGANNYMQAKVAGGGQSYAAYMNAWQKVTHNNMYYYFNEILKGTGITDNAEESYPVFVPVSSVYQTGRSFMYDGQKKYFKTMQPYVIPYGEVFNIDLGKYDAPNNQYSSGSIVIPDGFSYRIKSVTQPLNGTVEIVDNYNVKYTPNEKLNSGEILVTLEITKDDNAFKVEDVDLILEFTQSHESKKLVLERTTYAFNAEGMYTDAEDAFENNYDGYTNKTQADHANPVQNCNTDIWFYPDNQANRDKYPDAPESFFVHDNTIEEISGKLYFNEAGKYRIYLRGRLNCALYYSLDEGKTYQLGATIKDKTAPANSAKFRPADPNTYVDVKVEEDTWVYVKTVLIVQSTPAVSYVGLGTLKWAEPMFTIVEDENGVAHYYDSTGKEVSEEESHSTEPIAPASNANPSYVNAYRANYKFTTATEFTTDYFYTRNYTSSYTDNVLLGNSDKKVVEEQCKNLNLHTGWGGNNLSVVLDGVTNQGGTMQLHTGGRPNANNPFTLVVDLGEICKANRFILFSQAGRSDPCFPKALKLYTSTDGQNYTLIDSYTDLTFNYDRQIINFPETELRYYKIEISESLHGHIIIRELQMWHVFEVNNGKTFSPDNAVFSFDKKWKSEQAASTFGHVYAGENGAEMKFKFNGTRLGLTSNEELGKKFEVYIDGTKVDSIRLKQMTGLYNFSYISEKLSEGTHDVVIRCIGKANIDSVIIYE